MDEGEKRPRRLRRLPQRDLDEHQRPSARAASSLPLGGSRATGGSHSHSSGGNGAGDGLTQKELRLLNAMACAPCRARKVKWCVRGQRWGSRGSSGFIWGGGGGLLEGAVR
jgi:hypothetical protein